MRKAAVVLCFGVVCISSPQAEELLPKTSAAFDRYVRAAEAGMSLTPFLRIDGLPDKGRLEAMATLRTGEPVIEQLTAKEGGRTIDIPDGMVHHWVGVVLAPGISIDQAVALLQDYDRQAEIYKPNVARSKLLTHKGDEFTFRLQFFSKKWLTVVVNSDHAARFTRHTPDRVSSIIHSTRTAEVEDPGTPREREKPVGEQEGFLWRLNSYWRFEQRKEGVYIQCESITLTRGIPSGFLGFIVKPFVTSIPRETLSFTLETTRKTLVGKGAVKPRA